MHNKRNDLTNENGCVHKNLCLSGCIYIYFCLLNCPDWNIRHAHILTQGKLSKQSLYKGDFKLTLTKSVKRCAKFQQRTHLKMHCGNFNNTAAHISTPVASYYFLCILWETPSASGQSQNSPEFIFEEFCLRKESSMYSMTDTDTDVPLSKVPMSAC